MKKRSHEWVRGCAVLMLAFFLIFSAAGAYAGENLLENSGFDSADTDGTPEGWYEDAYILDPGYTVFTAEKELGGRTSVVTISNIGPNDARYAQVVPVEPDSLYCLSGYILADHVEGKHGANLSIEGVYAFSEEVFDTGGEWQYIEYYGETGPDQEYITVFVRLGGYSGECTGKASFDQITLTKVDSVPGDTVADLWFSPSREQEQFDDTSDDDSIPGTAWPWLLLAGVVFLGASAAAAGRFSERTDIQPGRAVARRNRTAEILILLIALLFRIFLSHTVKGYMVDVNCFLSWGRTMAENGPSQFYQATSFCDYPPLYTYIMGLNSLISSRLHADPAATQVIFRFIPCLCDVISAWLVYRVLIGKHESRPSGALFFLGCLALNPATILNSAGWGQMDSVLCLLLLLVAGLAMEKKWHIALPLYAVSVLVKPQALMFGPLGLVFAVLIFLKEKDSRRKILIGLAAGILVLFAGAGPFLPGQDAGSQKNRLIVMLLTGLYPVNPVKLFSWLTELYGGTLSSYPYATLNTANLYYLTGGNWAKLGLSANIAASVILANLSFGYGLLWFFRSRGLPGRLAETIISAAFAVFFSVAALAGLSWSVIGTAAMVLAFMIVIGTALRSRRIGLLAWLGGLLIILLYVFGVKMHERYVFPALLLLAAAFTILRDRRILLLLALFSFTLFLNQGIVLDNSIRFGSEYGHLNPDTVWLADILSVLNIIGACCAVCLNIDLLNPGKGRTFRNGGPIWPVRKLKSQELSSRPSPDRKLHWTRKDTLIILSITLIYSAVSLLTLGSTRAPETTWVSSDAQEQVVIDLGEERDAFSILYFAQVSRNDFSVSVSSDLENWEEETWAQMDQGQCWKWKYVTESIDDGSGERTYYNYDRNNIIRFSGRYVRITSCQIGLKLNELLFRDESGEILPAAVISRSGAAENSELYSDPEALLDEQDSFEGLPVWFSSAADTAQPSWWNSTYFDEIYHARTAYEFLKGTVPYETSHPPLGKILMSISVAVFGMTPFGWRFAGALAGILMLPGMYLLGKQLTKKTGIASLACLLMALDCLHLTQTQIATIDSFPVLFIIFAYYFMLRFMQTDLRQEKMTRILMNLAASGLFMGLAIASKWIGIYAGAGLAVLFFLHLVRQSCLRPSVSGGDGDMPAGKEPETLFPRTVKICCWCVLFYIAVPLAIYLLSYIPYMAYNSARIKSLADYISEVWRAQVGMFNYHSTRNLGMDHPFYSPWWEWPIIGKPMYYASEQFVPGDSPVHHSIFCFGNPVIWFGGLAAVAYSVFRWLRSKRYRLDDDPGIWHLRSDRDDTGYLFIFIGLLAQYLPWVLVPRGTYIYHYFASLPFLMLTVSVSFSGYRGSVSRWAMILKVLLLVSALAGFLLLFPYASGIAAPVGWLEIGKKLLRIWY